MKENRALVRWGALCALVSGLAMIAPLVFYFFVQLKQVVNASLICIAHEFFRHHLRHGHCIRKIEWFLELKPSRLFVFTHPDRVRQLHLHTPSPL